MANGIRPRKLFAAGNNFALTKEIHGIEQM
jgi:hypothetical protein